MSSNRKQHPNLSSARQFINRREMSAITGISVPALSVMAGKRQGPICRIPEAFSENKYELVDVLAWMRGESIPVWPDPQKYPPNRSKRGANMVKKIRPGRKPITKPGSRNASKGGGE